MSWDRFPVRSAVHSRDYETNLDTSDDTVPDAFVAEFNMACTSKTPYEALFQAVEVVPLQIFYRKFCSDTTSGQAASEDAVPSGTSLLLPLRISGHTAGVASNARWEK